MRGRRLWGRGLRHLEVAGRNPRRSWRAGVFLGTSARGGLRGPRLSPLSGPWAWGDLRPGAGLDSDAVGRDRPFLRGTGAQAESLILAQNERWRRA
jgi:hypothetical protein